MIDALRRPEIDLGIGDLAPRQHHRTLWTVVTAVEVAAAVATVALDLVVLGARGRGAFRLARTGVRRLEP